MALQLLPYAHVFSSSMYEEDDLNLNLANCKNQPNAIEQIEMQAAKEEAEIEAEAQRKKAIVKNRANLKIARINLIYENAIFTENGPHRNMYPTPKYFIDLIEREVGVINFIKDPEISGPLATTAFTVITVATQVYIFPFIQKQGMQLIKNYLQKVPVVGPILGTSLSMGLRIINIPNSIAKSIWNPNKYESQVYEAGDEFCPGIPVFNEDGTPKMHETSNREITKDAIKIVAIVIAVKQGPSFIRKLIDVINELRATHLLNQDWTRTFFSSYFKWKVRKLRDIEAQYSIPNVFQSYPILDQPEYKCAHSGQLLIIPFKTPSNKIFQYSVIEDWLLSHHTCPVTKENLQANQLSFDGTTYEEIRYKLQAINR